MTRMLGFLEPICEKEKVHEIGATEEEMTERLEIYEHHRAAEAALVATTDVTCCVCFHCRCCGGGWR